jgi:hypothetical protein
MRISALGCTYREIFDGLSTGIADRGKSGEEHAAKKLYSQMIAASRIPSITHLGRAIFLLGKFARFRAFAMLRQSLQQFFRIDACRCMTMERTAVDRGDAFPP